MDERHKVGNKEGERKEEEGKREKVKELKIDRKRKKERKMLKTHTHLLKLQR